MPLLHVTPTRVRVMASNWDMPRPHACGAHKHVPPSTIDCKYKSHIAGSVSSLALSNIRFVNAIANDQQFPMASKCESTDIEQSAVPLIPPGDSIPSCKLVKRRFMARGGYSPGVDQLPPTVESMRSGWLSTIGSAATVVSRSSFSCHFL